MLLSQYDTFAVFVPASSSYFSYASINKWTDASKFFNQAIPFSFNPGCIYF
jgi:hypothetical protein